MPVLQEFKRVVKLVVQSKKQVLDNCQSRMFQMEQELREEEERLRRDTVDKLKWDQEQNLRREIAEQERIQAEQIRQEALEQARLEELARVQA